MKLLSMLLAMLMLSIGIARADDVTQEGIFVWVSGSETCYKLQDYPRVSYSEIDGVLNAVLTLKDRETPELTLPLIDGAKLKIAYGTFAEIQNPSDQSPANEVRKDGKYIIGGNIVIVKNGKQYNIDGTVRK